MFANIEDFLNVNIENLSPIGLHVNLLETMMLFFIHFIGVDFEKIDL